MTGSQTPCSFCCNFSFGGKEKLARKALTKDSNTYTPIPAVLCTPISAPVLVLPFTNELLKQFLKAYLEAQTQLA